MKVLLIGNLSSTVILFREKLIKKLASSGLQVHTLTMDNHSANFEKISSYGAIAECYSFSRSGLNPVSDLINTLKLSKKIKKINPDVVLCFFPKPVIYGAFAAKLAGVKKIYSLLEGLGFCFTEHSTKDSFKKKLLKTIQIFLYKLSLPLSTKILLLNKDDYNDLILGSDIVVNDYEVIGGIGVDLQYFKYKKPNTSVIHFGMVSRLLVEKGVREFVFAARTVKHKYPNVEFSIAGAIDDNPGGITQHQIDIWEKEGVVKFLGQINDVKSYLEDISVFVLPSYREGVPKSTQEAMSIGRAVITTNVPGCRETIKHGINGFMIPPWKASALAEAMISFVNDPDLIVTMGVESRKIAEAKFDENDAADKLINILLAQNKNIL